ncbi:hypothetical protein CR513_43955, partial [Mucuna pruriens]
MSFRPPIHYSFRQQHPVCGPIDDRVLLLTQNKAILHFAVRRSKRMIGRRTSTSTLVVPYHATLNYPRNHIQINIWYGHYDSSSDRRTLPLGLIFLADTR